MRDAVSAFDDLTLGEVEVINEECLGGKTMASEGVDPLMVAGAVMWMTQKREKPDLLWKEFKDSTRMADLRAFSEELEAADLLNPTSGQNVPRP